MSFRAAPGGILAASQALREPRRAYTREQVAYFIRLAYMTGKLHGLHESFHDGGQWSPTETPEQIRARRVAARMAGYGPDTGYRGGAVDWETGR